jgi:hypothetical protein
MAMKMYAFEWLITGAGIAILSGCVYLGIRCGVDWFIWSGAVLGLAIALLPIMK